MVAHCAAGLSALVANCPPSISVVSWRQCGPPTIMTVQGTLLDRVAALERAMDTLLRAQVRHACRLLCYGVWATCCGITAAG